LAIYHHPFTGDPVSDHAAAQLPHPCGKYGAGDYQACGSFIQTHPKGKDQHEQHLDEIAKPIDDPGYKKNMDVPVQSTIGTSRRVVTGGFGSRHMISP
jgi:hypothetical protein